MSEERGRWDCLERISLFLEIVLGVIAFIWQLEERIAAGRESLRGTYTNVAWEDTGYVVTLIS